MRTLIGTPRNAPDALESTLRFLWSIAAAALMLVCALPARAADDAAIASRTADIDGIKIHYLTAGQGPTVILLHGYTQTSHMWRPAIATLAKKFMVIAPDLPGIGDSEIPS